jgi:hypothetical protein
LDGATLEEQPKEATVEMVELRVTISSSSGTSSNNSSGKTYSSRG